MPFGLTSNKLNEYRDRCASMGMLCLLFEREMIAAYFDVTSSLSDGFVEGSDQLRDIETEAIQRSRVVEAEIERRVAPTLPSLKHESMALAV